MNKFELKEKLIEIADQLDAMGGDLLAPDAADKETADIRSEVITELSKLSLLLHKKIYISSIKSYIIQL